jgi:UDP-glucose 4-epimerase
MIDDVSGLASDRMNYLITGGAGFIGSHLADALLARGGSVVALDDISTGSIENVRHLLEHPRFTLREGTVLDHPLVAQLAGRADVVVHLAAAVGVKLIVEHPLRSLITNIRGTEIVLDASAMGECRVLVASTSEIYGKNAWGPLHENADRILGSPFVARWSYSEAKAVDEILAHAYWRERGTEAIVVRLFNCVGPRQTGVYGMVVPTLVRQALLGEDLTVFGTGEQMRCFCHVADTVEAMIALLDHPDSPGEPFNIGANHETSINALAAMAIERTGSRSTVVHIPYEVAYEQGFEDMERRVPDTSKLEILTGWTPSHDLEHTIDDVIEFERSRLDPVP